MNLSHSTIYEQLALAAGKAAGIADPTLGAVARHGEAREARDLAWIEFDGLLADKTQTLKKIGRWLFERGVSVSDASVHRARKRLLDSRRLEDLKNARTAEILKALSGLDGKDVLDTATKKAGQILLELFAKLQPEQLENLDAGQWLRAFDVAGKLQRSRAQTGLAQERLSILREAAKNIAAAVGDAKVGGKSVIETVREALGIGETA